MYHLLTTRRSFWLILQPNRIFWLHFWGAVTPSIILYSQLFWFSSCWLVWWNFWTDSSNQDAVCHRCGWLCGEGDWGLGDVWKAPVLINKDTQRISEGPELLTGSVLKARLWGQTAETQEGGEIKSLSMFVHTHVAVVVVSGSGAVSDGLWAECAAVVSWRREATCQVESQQSKDTNVKQSCQKTHQRNRIRTVDLESCL